MGRKKTSLELYRKAKASLMDSSVRRPVYFFYGEETFFHDLLQKTVIGLIPEDQRDFNMDLLYGSDVTPSQVLDIARSYPMMSELRVVIVREFNRMKGGDRDGGDLNDFLPYLESPNPQTLLILFDSSKPDKRTKVGKALTGSSERIHSMEFEKMDDRSLPSWIEEWVEHRHRKRVEPRAAQMLLQLAGNDLRLLSSELDKVCTFVDTSELVTVKDVTSVIGSYREFSTIELKEAVLSRDLEKSLRIVEQMLLQRTTDTGEVIRTVGFFYSVFGNIWPILRLREKGLDKSRIRKELGISSSWYFDLLWKDASNFGLSDMPRVFEALLDADRAGKGFTTLDTSSILLLLVRRLVG